MPRPRKPASPFRYFNSSPEVIRLVVMMYVRFPLSLRNVEDLLFERGIVICHETVRMWWNRFGSMFASEIRRQRAPIAAAVRVAIRVDRHAAKFLTQLQRHSDLVRIPPAPPDTVLSRTLSNQAEYNKQRFAALFCGF